MVAEALGLPKEPENTIPTIEQTNFPLGSEEPRETSSNYPSDHLGIFESRPIDISLVYIGASSSQAVANNNPEMENPTTSLGSFSDPNSMDMTLEVSIP
jgi:hypothetical protein